jgi:predicted DNA-binding transcriptional regulator AlpA
MAIRRKYTKKDDAPTHSMTSQLQAQSAPSIAPAVFSIPQAAVYLGVSRASVYRLPIRRIKLGSRTVISRAELDAMLAG